MALLRNIARGLRSLFCKERVEGELTTGSGRALFCLRSALPLRSLRLGVRFFLTLVLRFVRGRHRNMPAYPANPTVEMRKTFARFFHAGQ